MSAKAAKSLLLLRHAKSAWEDAALPDVERPLARRGEKAARAMGALFAERDWLPDAVLVSSARRTRETWAIIAPQLPGKRTVHVLDTLYHASPKTLLGQLTAIAEPTRCALLIGHNPGLHALSMELAGDGSNEADLARLRPNLPTAGLARFAFDGPWATLRAGGARLSEFIAPRDLD